MATAPVAPAAPQLHLSQVRDALLQLRDGNFSKRLPEELPTYSGMVARVFNSLAELMERFAAEQLRLTNEIGTAGELGGQAEIFGIDGQWRKMHDDLNRMGANLTVEVRLTTQYIAKVLAGENPPPLKPKHIAGEFAQLQAQIVALAQRVNDQHAKT